MAVVEGKSGFIAVFVEEFASPQIVSFIHAEVDAARTQCVIPKIHHFFDQSIALFLIDQQDVFRVLEVAVVIPTQNRLKVAERLDRGDHFNVELLGVLVDFPDLRLCVGAAQVAEVGLVGQLIGVFGIEHRHVEAEKRHAAKPPFEIIHPRHPGTGAVEQNSVGGKKAFFATFAPGERQADAAPGKAEIAVGHGEASGVFIYPQEGGIGGLFPENIRLVGRVDRIFFAESVEQGEQLRRRVSGIPA